MAEEARLESVYTPKAYREFESRSLRKNSALHNSALFFYSRILKITAGSNEISTSSLNTEAEFT